MNDPRPFDPYDEITPADEKTSDPGNQALNDTQSVLEIMDGHGRYAFWWQAIVVVAVLLLCVMVGVGLFASLHVNHGPSRYRSHIAQPPHSARKKPTLRHASAGARSSPQRTRIAHSHKPTLAAEPRLAYGCELSCHPDIRVHAAAGSNDISSPGHKRISSDGTRDFSFER
jgi:hypothetical protein